MGKKIGLVLSVVPGYSETFFRNKVRVLEEQGFEVILFTQKSEQSKDFKVISAPYNYKRRPILYIVNFIIVFTKLMMSSYSRVTKFIRTERLDGISWKQILKIVYFNAHILSNSVDWLHFGFATLTIGRENLAKAIGAKMAVSFRGYDINVYPIKQPNCYKKLWSKVDKVHSISDSLYQKALGLGLDKSVNYKKITPAIDVSYFTVGNKMPLQNVDIEVFTVARLTWIKGLDFAIEAMAILIKKGINIKYTIAGDGVVFNRLRFMVHQLGLDDYIEFAGELSKEEIVKRLKSTDIYIQPSIDEGFCNAVLEAQACKCLCIASDVGGLKENIVDGVTGWLVPKRSPLSIANKIEELTALSKEQKNKVVQNAHTRVKESFSLEFQRNAFKSFYE